MRQRFGKFTSDELKNIDSEELQLIAEVMDGSGDLWPYSRGGKWGPKIGKARDDVADYFVKKGAKKKPLLVPTSSGTASIHVALGGLGIEAGSEVIVSPITDPGSVTPIIVNNNIPVFADVDPESGLITPETVKDKLTSRTRAVIAVHLTGSPVDVPGIRSMLLEQGHDNVKVIEDVAQGLGATLNGVPLGILGHAGCFSLNSWKHITVGEGGFVLVHNDNDFNRCHNFSDKYRTRFANSDHAVHGRYKGVGLSLRMSEIQGAMLIAQLKRLDQNAAARYSFGMALEKAMLESPLMPQSHLEKSYPTFFGFMFTVNSPQKDYDEKSEIAEAVNAAFKNANLNISMGASYNHEDLPIYKYDLFKTKNFFPNSAKLWPAEEIANLIAEKEGQETRTYNYKDRTVICENAEDYLKRSFWLRMNETHRPEIAQKIVDIIVDVFRQSKII